MKIYNSILLIGVFIHMNIYSQTVSTDTLNINGIDIDVFSYQIPENYSGQEPVPLLVIFHQWGGNQNSTYFTGFDEEANTRGWLYLSPFGGAVNNYNHQGAQEMVQGEILWMIDNFNVDINRIYMAGGSMGGAAGAIYANNHLNPELPMVAATASASGILDCERRSDEMDGNNSMIQWFGGTPVEVPFEYHRNSAVFFMDSTQSMHFNLQYTPLYLDFGASEAHRYHAEDLYDLLMGYNQNMWIDTNPSGGHGFSVMDPVHACDWMEVFILEDDPDNINVNMDEPGRAYWTEALDQNIPTEFIRVVTHRNSTTDFTIHQFANSDSLLLYLLQSMDTQFMIRNESAQIYSLGLTGIIPVIVSGVMLNGQTYEGWSQIEDYLWIDINGEGDFSISLAPQFEDVNQDGTWSVLDIIITMNIVLGINSPTPYQQVAGDLNQDGVVDILDIIQMVTIILNP